MINLYFCEENTPWAPFSILAMMMPMQTQILLKTTSALDKRNTRIVLTAQQLLQEGRTNEACNELRKIELRVANHPAVIQLRRNLVASLFGWEQEDTAISRLQPNGAPVAHDEGTVNGAPAANGEAVVNGNGVAHPIAEAVAA